MSDAQPPAPESAPSETPAQHIRAEQKKKNLYLRLTSSMPLLVTVIVHVLLGLVAAAVVVQQTTGEKKKTFEASQQVAAAPAVEHRLQVARRGGSSGGASSAVAANRIFSTDANALQMPAMPELPSMGAGGFGGFGGMGSGVGLGAGSGMATSLGGGTGLGGRGFMSLNFLGATNQNASRIIFIVDTSVDIMEPRKGGFRAFTIIREEIMRLVSRLSPSSQFNVILYDYNSGEFDNGFRANAFSRELTAANSEAKKAFFDWMTPVNATLGNFGPRSAARNLDLRARPVPESAGVNPRFLPPVWARVVQLALEQQPDVIYVITATQGVVRQRVDDETIAKRREEYAKRRADYEERVTKEGLDPKAVDAARRRAYDKARNELDALNRRLVQQNKEPVIIRWIGDLERSDIQAEFRRNNVSLVFDRTGWVDKSGRFLIAPDSRINEVEPVTWNEFYAHYARVQQALVPERPALNLFLFVGPDERPEESVRNLTTAARRNGGTFQLLTTKRLEEIRARAEADAAK